MSYEPQGDMMTASTISTRKGIGHKAKALVLGTLIACVGVAAFAGPANAAPFSMDLTNGRLNLGFAFKGAKIMPAPASVQIAALPAPATNLPDLWNARDTTDATNPTNALPYGCLTPAHLNITVNPPTPVGPPPPACTGNPSKGTVSGDLTGNAINVVSSPLPATNGGLGTLPGAAPPNAVSWGNPSGFRFPIMIVPNPLDQSPVPVTIASTGNVTGTFDAGTGAMSLTGPIEARVLVGLSSNPLGAYCALPLTGLTLSTASNKDFPGVPFTSGINGTGALTGTYSITADATAYGGADCTTVNQVSKGNGSIWLSNGITDPPVCPENTTGIPPDCAPIPCPTGFTGNEPNCVAIPTAAKIDKVTVKGPSKVKKGKVATYKVKISNSGESEATGVRLKVSGKGVSFNTSVGKIAGSSSRTTKVKLKAKKPGKVKVSFKVTSTNAGGKTVKKTITVKK